MSTMSRVVFATQEALHNGESFETIVAMLEREYGVPAEGARAIVRTVEEDMEKFENAPY